ncbi:restriction endonuclease subunit S [Cupriavidus sp. KK10]|jgi:type I restriction enzyme S subunit|uniref:restriction endonuclease subunit S n=1 Tax=Cupriavidus sp. KK10 TaxID=1478019 RepID=UPI001BA8E3B9|nr:restriction endonuclease subunit S [Cupriavidus sp. KK10]QUN27202.1 restriction endonuclease subunit S [Cupriavidus sp. KK10]
MSDQTTMQSLHVYERFLQHLPLGWERKEIRQLGTVVGGGTPSRNVPSFWRGTIPWVTPGEVSGNATKYLHDTNEHISSTGLASSGANLLPTGALMVTTRATLGARVINTVPMATNQGFKSIVFQQPADSDFYFHLFEKVLPELVRRASGTTFLEISGSEFGSIEVPMPAPAEKRLIAEILDTLDTAIHETEAIIAKLKAVKQGLLYDLLTRGIDTNGELRPPQAEAPHHYKESALGWIPKGWSVERISGVCCAIVDCPHSTPDFRDDGVLVARTMHIKDGTFLEASASRVSEREYCERILRLEPAPGDVIFTREAPVGEAFVIPNGMRICLGQRVMLLRPKQGRLIAEFLLAQIYSGAVKDRIATLTSGTTNPHLNVAEVKEFEIPLPPLEEQQLIADRVSSLESRIRREMLEREKLIASKSGLMDDLLTGRVRVTPLLKTQQVQHETEEVA